MKIKRSIDLLHWPVSVFGITVMAIGCRSPVSRQQQSPGPQADIQKLQTQLVHERRGTPEEYKTRARLLEAETLAAPSQRPSPYMYGLLIREMPDRAEAKMSFAKMVVLACDTWGSYEPLPEAPYAMQLLNDVIAKDPNNARAYIYRARCLRASFGGAVGAPQNEAIRADVMRAAAVLGDDPRVLIERERLAVLNSDWPAVDQDVARIKACKGVSAAETSDATYLFGLSKEAQSDSASAMATYRLALSENPRNTDPLYRLAMLEYGSGRIAEFDRDAKRVGEIVPGHPVQRLAVVLRNPRVDLPIERYQNIKALQLALTSDPSNKVISAELSKLNGDIETQNKQEEEQIRAIEIGVGAVVGAAIVDDATYPRLEVVGTSTLAGTKLSVPLHNTGRAAKLLIEVLQDRSASKRLVSFGAGETKTVRFDLTGFDLGGQLHWNSQMAARASSDDLAGAVGDE